MKSHQSLSYHFPKLHSGPCSGVGMRRGTDSHTDGHTTTVTNIHFASAVPHAKYNNTFGQTNNRSRTTNARVRDAVHGIPENYTISLEKT